MAPSWVHSAAVIWAVIGLALGNLVPHHRTRIIGGREAGLGEAPYQVSLRYTGTLPGGRQVEKEHFCGGALLDRETVLTASHCLLGEYGSADRLTVVGGALGLHGLPGQQEDREVTKIVAHPGYGTGFAFMHDIALLKVSPPFPGGSDLLRAVPLRTSPAPVGTACQLTGWGLHATQSAGYSENLNLLKLEVVNKSACIDRFNETLTETNSEHILCASHNDVTSSAGSGDSGGALVCGGELTGVLSFGAEEQTLTSPALMVFSDVQSYLRWIEDNRGPPATFDFRLGSLTTSRPAATTARYMARAATTPRYPVRPSTTPRYPVRPQTTPRYPVRPQTTPRYPVWPQTTPRYPRRTRSTNDAGALALAPLAALAGLAAHASLRVLSI